MLLPSVTATLSLPSLLSRQLSLPLECSFLLFCQISLYITFFGAAFLFFSLDTAITILLAFSSSSRLARLFLNRIFPLPASPFFYLHRLVTLFHGSQGQWSLRLSYIKGTRNHMGMLGTLHLLYQTVFIACAILCISPVLPYPKYKKKKKRWEGERKQTTNESNYLQVLPNRTAPQTPTQVPVCCRVHCSSLLPPLLIYSSTAVLYSQQRSRKAIPTQKQAPT